MSDLIDSPGGNQKSSKPEQKPSSIPFVSGTKIAYVTGFLLGLFVLRTILSLFLSYYTINFILGSIGLIVICSLLVSLLQPSGEESPDIKIHSVDSTATEWPLLCAVGQQVDASLIHAKLLSEDIPAVIETQSVSGYGLLEPLQQKIRVHPEHLQEARTVLAESPYGNKV